MSERNSRKSQTVSAVDILSELQKRLDASELTVLATRDWKKILTLISSDAEFTNIEVVNLRS